MKFARRFLHNQVWKKVVSLALAGAMLPGCTGTDKRLTYLGNAALQDYEDTSLRLQQPDVDEPTPDRVAVSQKPRQLGDRSRDELWDLSLAEALHLALTNNRIIRIRGDFRTAGQLYSNPDGVASVYDPAIRDSGVLFGGRGVEAALSAFDTQFTTNMTWGKSQTFQNNAFLSGGLIGGSILQQDTAQFQTAFQKTFGYGATATLAHNWNYSFTDQPFQLFPSVYTGNVGVQYSQPLWAGAGAEYTRIAGPAAPGLAGVTGVSQGVVIARINTDVSLVDFEAQVRNMLKDVEDVYWDLYLAYRTYDTTVEARNSFLRSWRFAHANKGVGKFSDLDEAQAREAYFEGRVASENAMQEMYGLETQLRRLCGLPSADGRIIRPSDDPSTGQFIPDWNICLVEGLTRREELRRQKWNIKSLELQLRAANSLTHPNLNFVSNYQLNGFGNNLFGQNGPPGSPGANLQSAYRTLANADQSSWNLGLQFNMPLGFRSALSQVRNYELRLAKAREVLATQELEVAHELTTTFQNLAWRYQTAQTNYNRWQTAEAQVPGRENRYKTGVPGVDTSVLLDQWLQARRRSALAEVTFYTSVVEYNKAITDLHFRKGTLLENNNVHLGEGAWDPEAYKDALRRAWARSFAIDVPRIDPVHSEPENFVREGNLGSVDFAGQGATDLLTPPADETDPLRSKSGPLTLPNQELSQPIDAPTPPAYDE